MVKVLRISFYLETKDSSEFSFGCRATVFPGRIPVGDLIATEITERRRKSRTVLSGRSTLSILATAYNDLVSADNGFSDALLDTMRDYSNRKIDLVFTEYQPAKSTNRVV